jgi:glycosyltransferase involved in cell wall biosynthesis
MNRPVKVVMLDAMSIVPYYTGHLCARLQQMRGLRVTLASPTYQHDPGFFDRCRVRHDPGLLNVTYRMSKLPASVRRIVKLVEYVLNLTALLYRCVVSKPDVLHVQFLPLLAHGLPVEAWWLRLAHLLRVKIVYTVHNVTPQDGPGRRSPYDAVYRLSDHFVCHDLASAKRIADEFDINADRITVIPHGPLFEDQRCDRPAARKHLGFAPATCVVLWQGILKPYKGVPFLLKAWKRVSEQDRHALLCIVGVGEPDIVRDIRRLVHDLGIADRVRLDLRFVSVDDLTRYFESADVVVYPYREITTSGALLTAIARGKATVASRLPAFEQILQNEETALLVPYGDIDALAGSLCRLVRDETLRLTLARRLAEAQAGIPRWTEIAARTFECYNAVLSGRGSSVHEGAKV